MAQLDAIDYLAQAAGMPVPAVAVAFGDEAFLKSLVLAEFRGSVLAGADAEFSLSRYDGDTAEPREVFDDLATVPLFGGGRRLAIVRDAGGFVSSHRGLLEDYVANPKPTGTLVLEVDAWPANTRLAKAVAASGLAVDCRLPPAGKLLKWLVPWTLARHGVRIERPAAELLLDLVGPELGLIDQELAKLSGAADGPVTPQLVRRLVGGFRAKTTWDMLDRAAEGKAAEAIHELDRLLLAGENPIAILAQIGSTLRRFAAATRVIEQHETEGRRITLSQALQAAGMKPIPFIINKAQSQLKQIGRQRAARLYAWLLEADLALKGHSSSPARARIVLEQLIARLATPQPSARPH
ncbi:MAG: DNA polymerase III subunit delta [Pirellulales bacterium]